MKPLILLLLWSTFSVQAGISPFGCSVGGACNKSTEKSKAPTTPTQKLNPPPSNSSNSNNNTTYTNSTNPSQSGTRSPKPAPTLPNLNQTPKRLPPPKQN